jgi:cell division protein FtsB
MRKPTKIVVSALLTCALLSIGYAQEATPEERLRELELKLEQATKQIEELNDTVRALRAEIDRIKSETAAREAAAKSD